MIADGVIDSISGVPLSHQPPLSVPPQMAPGVTPDLTHQVELFGVQDGGEGRQALHQHGASHHAQVEGSLWPCSSLVVTKTGDIALGVTHCQTQPG